MTFPGNSLLTAAGAARSVSAVVLHGLGFNLCPTLVLKFKVSTLVEVCSMCHCIFHRTTGERGPWAIIFSSGWNRVLVLLSPWSYWCFSPGCWYSSDAVFGQGTARLTGPVSNTARAGGSQLPSLLSLLIENLEYGTKKPVKTQVKQLRIVWVNFLSYKCIAAEVEDRGGVTVHSAASVSLSICPLCDFGLSG